MVTWVLVAVLVLVLGGVAAVAAGRTGTWEEPERDRVAVRLPDGPLTRADLGRVRFPMAFRGYRMADVDALLDRLGRQLEDAPAPSATGHGAQDDGGESA
ncbi:DivIVA domain-containing protein [Nocardioides solisilvae]|uniref:DivIVA domain-containing protein n=1 Tax=Nocardioides solisilvae TaxID=1542435 RepID=UPI000D74FB22|nr:DivIVA domain-containing protein [Nocardioides solisilvae]